MAHKLQNIGKALKKKAPLIMLCATVVVGSYWMLHRHYLQSAGTLENDLIYKIESKLLDFRFRIRGPQKPTGEVGILAIDEKTITRFGVFPFPRHFYAQALMNLKKLGVKWVGFDAVYPESERTKLVDVANELKMIGSYQGRDALARTKGDITRLQKWTTESRGDQLFAKGIADAGNIVLGFFYFGSSAEVKDNLGVDKSKYYIGLEQMLSSEVVFDLPEGRKLDDYPIRRTFGIKGNIPMLSAATENFAFFSNDADDDAINRWVTLIANIDGHLLPSLSLKTVAQHLNSDIVVFFDDVGVESVALVNREDTSKAIEIPTDPYGAGRILVNHRGPGKTFHHYSLADAYFNTFNPKEKKALNGASLLLGATATGTNDLRPNVYDPAIDGVENHAAVMDNVIRKDFIFRPTTIYATELLIVLAVGLLFSPLMIWGSSLISGLAVVLFLMGYWYFDWMVWFSKGTWAYIAVPSIEILGLFITSTLYKYATEEREKKKVKGAFEHYLSPDVIKQVLDDPSTLALGGDRKEITVFFSDVRSFTTISESLSPEKLCEFMNEYFTPMTAIILGSGGTLDKYIGDAIMAFWGAPVSMPNHASVAAKAAVQMLFALDKLRHDMPAKGFPKPDIGIGLNTGPMSVGNMGSAARFSYTVMGDAVNLGSRLEGLTKDYGIKIMVSEFTAKQLSRNELFFRDLDDIRVKGKNEPVNVYELMRPDLLPQPAMIQNLIGEFEEGRKAYKGQQWDKAEKHFTACLQLRPDDGPTNLYLTRVLEYKKASPGETWDGVYTFKHK